MFERDFSWLFDENGKVAKGKKCVARIESYYYDEEKIVELAGYRPYYTDGTPDPKNDEVDELCYIEVEGDIDDLQVRLENLFEIDFNPVNKETLYNNEIYKVVGVYNDGYEDKGIIQKYGDEKYIFVSDDDTEEHKDCTLLSEEDLRTLYYEVTFGSLYLSDFRNSVGITREEAMDITESYDEHLSENYDDPDEYDTEDNFVTWHKSEY